MVRVAARAVSTAGTDWGILGMKRTDPAERVTHMAGSDLGTEKKLTVADAIIALTRDRIVYDREVLAEVARRREAEHPRKTAQGIIEVDFPVRYEDFEDGRYDE